MTISDQINAVRADVAREIEAFLERADMSAAQFGIDAMGDKRFVYELRKGRKIGPETIDAVRLFMAAYRVPKRKRPAGNDRVAA